MIKYSYVGSSFWLHHKIDPNVFLMKCFQWLEFEKKLKFLFFDPTFVKTMQGYIFFKCYNRICKDILNLPMDDCYFGYITKMTKEKKYTSNV
jgi:hypothetical protein